MKIVCISDTHGKHEKLTETLKGMAGDILMFAGDLQKNEFDMGAGFISWFHSMPFTYKVMIFGNHDGNYVFTGEAIKQYDDIFLLNDSGVCINGLNIYGSPYSVSYGNWSFMKTEFGLEKIYSNIPENTDILMTHTPPFGISDLTVDGVHAGSNALARRIKDLPNLKYHIFGHIHEGYGISRANQVTYINVSSLDKTYHNINEPFTVIGL